jgi:hypothetical protein
MLPKVNEPISTSLLLIFLQLVKPENSSDFFLIDLKWKKLYSSKTQLKEH